MTTGGRAVAVVTGAAGGIGAGFVEELVHRGHDVFAVDVRREPLEQLCSEVSLRGGPKAHAVVVDLSKRDEVEQLARRIEGENALTMLVNNAGYGLQGEFAVSDPAAQLALIDVNVVAAVRLARAALPRLIDRHRGSLINLSSIGGFRPGGEWATYSASKRFIIQFTESLQEELGDRVRLQALCPGFTRTGFHDVSGFVDAKDYVPPQLWMTPREVAIASLDALSNKGVVFVPGPRAKVHLATAYIPHSRRILYAVLRRLPFGRKGREPT